MEEGYTNIRVSDKVRDFLESKKIHPNQSYNEVLEKYLPIEVRA